VFRTDSITTINVVRDTLRSKLTDPRYLAGGEAGRSWIHTDVPLAGAKYPRIQLKKLDNPTSIIDIGRDYTEHEYVIINCWVYVKNGFKVTISGTEYKNEQIVEYYLGEIANTLKDNQTSMYNSGVGGYRKINTTSVEYDDETQLFYGAVTVRVWFFHR
jgi:hypothetical protein